MSNILKFGVPKGSLEEATVGLFRQAGWNISISSRSYFPGVDDPEMNCKLIRPQEMGKYVQRGTIDVGIAGRDWVAENQADVVEVCEMVYSKVSRRPVRWVLVVAQDSPVRKPEDLAGGVISTELVGFTERYFAERAGRSATGGEIARLAEQGNGYISSRQVTQRPVVAGVAEQLGEDRQGQEGGQDE